MESRSYFENLLRLIDVIGDFSTVPGPSGPVSGVPRAFIRRREIGGAGLKVYLRGWPHVGTRS